MLKLKNVHKVEVKISSLVFCTNTFQKCHIEYLYWAVVEESLYEVS